MKPSWLIDVAPGALFALRDNPAFCVRFIRYDACGEMTFRVEKRSDDMGAPGLFDALDGHLFSVDYSTWHDEAQSVLIPLETPGHRIFFPCDSQHLLSYAIFGI